MELDGCSLLGESRFANAIGDGVFFWVLARVETGLIPRPRPVASSGTPRVELRR